MKKFLRIIILSALFLILLIPIANNYFYSNQKVTSVNFNQSTRMRNISELNRLAKKEFYAANYSGSINYYQEIIKLAPFDLESRRNLAALYNDKNDLKAENKILLETVILGNQKEDYLNLAVNYYETANYKASKFLLENKLINEFEDENLFFKKYYYLIKNNYKLNEIKAAEKNLNKLSELEIKQPQVFLLKAKLYKLKKDYKKAYNYFNQAYQANKSKSYLFKDMALMLELAGEEIEAYNHWQRALGYGWFKELAYQKINYYQDKYPQLKADMETEDPEEINPFALDASWFEVKELKTQEESQILRIGIQENNKHLLFQYSDPFSVVSDGKIIYRGEAKKNYLLERDGESIYLRTEEKRKRLGSSEFEYQIYSNKQNSSFYVYNINYGQGYFWQGSGNRQYRGNMIIRGEGEEFSLINQIRLTPYLLSVVPSEIYASWPLEALKAQAIAARSYTLNNLGRHSSDGYDLCSSVHCAAYNGVQSEHENTTKAVLDTQLETAVFDNKIIEAVFSSNSGGATERSDQIWSADLEYLRGSNQMKNEDYQFPLEPIELYSWLFYAPPSYSKDYGSSNYRWQISIPAEIIEYRSEIKSIKNIEVLKRANKGTITSLRISGADEEKEYSSSQIRRVLGGLKSSRFYFNSHFDKNDNLEEIYVYGSGWGHNLGLDQSASAGMGKAGYTYQEIIKHFYPGVEIKKYN